MCRRCNNGTWIEGQQIALFTVHVDKVIITLRDDQIVKKSVVLTVYDLYGNKKGPKPIPYSDIPKLDYKCFGIDTSNMTVKGLKLLNNKVIEDADRLLPVTEYQVTPGITPHEKNSVIQVIDDVVNSTDHTSDIITSTSTNSIRIDKAGTVATLDLKAIPKLICFMPLVSVMIFYAALFAVLKPILKHLKERIDAAFAVIGPKGSLKTTMVIQYALWRTEIMDQFNLFQDSARIDMTEKRILEASGINWLFDDLHKVSGSTAKNRQVNLLDKFVRGAFRYDVNIIVTGESLMDMGIPSLFDRIVQIKIPRKYTSELGKYKLELSRLDFELMPKIAMYFSHCLVNHWNEMCKIIEEHNRRVAEDMIHNSNQRIFRNTQNLLLTEMLFCRFCCNEDAQISCRQELLDAIEYQNGIQLDEMAHLNEEKDIIYNTYRMMTAGGKYITLKDNLAEYKCDSSDYLLLDKHMWICKDAWKCGMKAMFKHPFDWKLLLTELSDQSLLDEDTRDKTKQLTLADGRRVRHAKINVKDLVDYLKSEGYDTELSQSLSEGEEKG